MRLGWKSKARCLVVAAGLAWTAAPRAEAQSPGGPGVDPGRVQIPAAQPGPRHGRWLLDLLGLTGTTGKAAPSDPSTGRTNTGVSKPWLPRSR